MSNSTGTKVIAAVVAIVVIGLGYVVMNKESGPGKYDQFATCIKDSGATFYGAFWCPHCQEQKRMFGSSAKLLPYIECSLPDGKTRTQECIDKGIESYPTWFFKDGTKKSGAIPLDELAKATSCTLPE